MKYKTYAEYKDSGVEWLGEVLAHWISSKLKHFSDIIDCKHITAKFFDDGIPSPSIGEVKGWEVNLDNAKYTSDEYYRLLISGGRKPKAGDIIYSRNATVGQAALVTEFHPKFAMGQDVCLIRVYSDLDPEFLLYQLNAKFIASQLDLAMVGSTFKRINVDKIRNFSIVAPSIMEQKQIATFLDKETAKIDTLIDKQQHLIKLLQEKRQAVISHAVTKGLNPAAKMKNSGVEWLGEVPAHWNCSRLKYLSKQIVDGAHFTPTYVDRGVPFLRVTDIHAKDINLEQAKCIPVHEHVELIKRCKPEKGDLLLSKNGTIGIPKVIDWDWEFSIFVSLCLIKLNGKLIPEYTAYSFLSRQLKEQIFGLIKQSTVINLHLDKIANFWLCVPPLHEQNEIVKQLNHRLSKLDNLINKAEQAVKLLKERRIALISAAVTGKIDVRDAV